MHLKAALTLLHMDCHPAITREVGHRTVRDPDRGLAPQGHGASQAWGAKRSLGFVSQWGGLSPAPEFGPWLAAVTQGAVCEEPQGSHSRHHIFKATVMQCAWIDIANLDSISYRAAEYVENNTFELKMAGFKQPQILTIIMGSLFVCLVLVWQHQIKKNQNHTFFFVYC